MTFIQSIKYYQRRLNLRIAAISALSSMILLFVGFHLYYILWKHLEAGSSVLLYSNIAIRISLVLSIIFVLWDGYHSFFSLFATARLLDKLSSEDDDLYQNSLELRDKHENNAIVDILECQASKRLASCRYRLPSSLNSLSILAIISFFFGILIIWSLDWQNFLPSLKQFYTNRTETVIYKDIIELSPGNIRIGKNQDVLIKVVNPEHRLKHRLFYRWDSQWRELAMSQNAYLFERLDHSIEYYVENDAARSEVFKIEVLDIPYALGWKVHYEYPSYTGLAAFTDSLSYGNITAYAGTSVRLQIRSNVDLESAKMRFTNGADLELSRQDSRNYSLRFNVNEAANWYLELTDSLGRKSIPEEKTITVLPDNPPQIRILFPARDISLDQEMLVPIIFSADDDFGLQDCSINYQINSNAVQSLLIQKIIPGKLYSKDYIFNLKSFNLMPGDVVSYWLEIYDNAPARQKAESAKFSARFPSVEEIFREIEQRQQSNYDELQSVADRQQDIKEDFEKMRRELLREDNPDWSQQQQLQQLLEEQESLGEQIEEISQSYQELIDRMQQNAVISPEMLQKMQRIQELMEEINNSELQDALSRMQDALENLQMDELRKAMENFRFSMEDFAQKLQQTLDLLESVKLEQEMQKALQISQEMENMQAELLNRSQNPENNPEALAREQERISQKYDTLQQELQNIQEMMQQNSDSQQSMQMQEMQQEMQQSGMQQDMQQSKQQLTQNQRAQATQSQSEALRKMRQFTRRLQEMKDSMSSGSQGAIMQAIETAARELLVFSRKHEETAAKYLNNPYPIVPELISTYEGVQLSLNKLYSNPMVMLYLPPKFYVDLAMANSAYREIFVGLGDSAQARIDSHLTRIQQGLNLMVYDLIQAMQNQGGGGGGGMQSLMQMLQQMSQEQLAMNMLTQQLLQQIQQNGGSMSPAMQSQMQRLAADQQRLADNLKRALQNDPRAQQQANTIQQIIDEAEAVARQLRNNQISRDLLNRQERIISRMLDAQRSINQREQSRERKAESSTRQNWGEQISPTDFEALRRRAILDDGYRAYPMEYQQQIIEYLKRINSGVQP